MMECNKMQKIIKRSVSVILSLILLLTVFSGCAQTAEPKNEASAAEKEIYSIKESEIRTDAISTEPVTDDMSDYIESFTVIAKVHANELYHGAYNDDNETAELADHMVSSFTEDGKAVIVANFPDSYGAGHHAFVILKSQDFGETWACNQKYYYVDSSVEQILINGSNVYMTLNGGAWGRGSVWYSGDFCDSFTIYDGYEMSGDYALTMEENAATVDLQILDIDETSGSVLLGWCLKNDLYNAYEPDDTGARDRFVLTALINAEFDKAEIVYVNESEITEKE